MSDVKDVEPVATEAVVSGRGIGSRQLPTLAMLMALGWLGTNLGLNIGEFPLKFLLKDSLHKDAAAVSAFFAIGACTNYVKPLAGVMVDGVPLFRTRRRWYLIGSLLLTGLLWLLMAFVPKTYNSLLLTYGIMYVTVVFTSTSLGGVMVEVGHRFNAAGRLTSQRIGCFRLANLLSGPIAGRLTQYCPFIVSMGAASLLHLILVPLYIFGLPEEPTARLDRSVLKEAVRQFKILLNSKVLLAAAGMIFLIAASPGFNTPLLFHQTNDLHFSKEFIGYLTSIAAATGLLTTIGYFAACRKFNVRTLIVFSIIVHALGTIAYLFYHDKSSAIAITAISGVTGTLTMLPVYDLAARGTPKGSESIGYAVMMSVWNLTNALSDWTGSTLFARIHLAFSGLVWVNAGTTLLVLLVVPFLPVALMTRRDGPV